MNLSSDFAKMEQLDKTYIGVRQRCIYEIKVVHPCLNINKFVEIQKYLCAVDEKMICVSFEHDIYFVSLRRIERTQKWKRTTNTFLVTIAQ